MAADRYIVASDSDLAAAITGATLTADDRIFLFDSDINFIEGDLSGQAIILFQVGDDFTGDIGSGGTAIQLDATGTGGGLVDYAGRGDWAYFSGDADDVLVRGGVPGVVKWTTGTVTDFTAEGGQVVIAAAAVATNLYSSNGQVWAGDNGTAFALAVCGVGSSVESDRGATVLHVGAGGVWRHTNRARAVARFECWGTLIYQGGNVTGASSILFPGGVLDLSKLRANVSFSNALIGHPGSRIIYPAVGGPTVTLTISRIGTGPKIEYAT